MISQCIYQHLEKCFCEFLLRNGLQVTFFGSPVWQPRDSFGDACHRPKLHSDHPTHLATPLRQLQILREISSASSNQWSHAGIKRSAAQAGSPSLSSTRPTAWVGHIMFPYKDHGCAIHTGKADTWTFRQTKSLPNRPCLSMLWISNYDRHISTASPSIQWILIRFYHLSLNQNLSLPQPCSGAPLQSRFLPWKLLLART